MVSARLERLLELLKEDAEDPFLSFALAKEYQKSGSLEKASEIYLDLIKKRPDYSGTYYHLGKLFEQLGKLSEAIDIYRQGINITASADPHANTELKQALANLTGDDEN